VVEEAEYFKEFEVDSGAWFRVWDDEELALGGNDRP
jgi:hypothetical protein